MNLTMINLAQLLQVQPKMQTSQQVTNSPLLEPGLPRQQQLRLRCG